MQKYMFDVIHTYEVRASSFEDAVYKVKAKYPHRLNTVQETSREFLHIEKDKGSTKATTV